MTLIPADLDYTNIDQASLEARLFALLESAFPEWTDRDRADFGNILVGMFGYVGDRLCFYQNNQGREAFPATATQRKSHLAHARACGYTPCGGAAATTTETFTLAASPTADVIIPAGSTLRTKEVTDPEVFQLLDDVEIAASASPPIATGTVEHSESHEELVVSDEQPNQEFELGSTPYLDGSAAVTFADGAYTQADDNSFLSSTASDRHFVVIVDQNDRAKLRFGNGTNGKIPVGTGSIAYKTGGGEAGNVEPHAICRIDGSFTDVAGNPVMVTVDNAEAASGGRDRESVAELKVNVPASLQALTRTVGREDFEIGALRVAGVARALMLTSDEDPTLTENTGQLYIVPAGGGTPSEALKAAVLTMVTVTCPCTLTFQVTVIGAVYSTMNVQATLWLTAGANPATVESAVEAALAEYFAISDEDGNANTRVDFGFNLKDADGNPAGEIPLSDIFDAIRDTEGVRKVGAEQDHLLLNGAHQDVPIALRDFPTLGTVTLINGATGLPL